MNAYNQLCIAHRKSNKADSLGPGVSPIAVSGSANFQRDTKTATDMRS